MHQDDIKVTAIVPNYNYGKYFERCFNGLLNQKRRPNRIIIVDDQSTDDSFEQIESILNKRLDTLTRLNTPSEDFSDYFTGQLDKVKLNLCRALKNGGPSATRNLAIKETMSDTHAFALCDSDDIYYPEKISKSLNILFQYPQVGLVYSDYITVNEEGKKTREYKEPYNYERLCQECIVSNNSMIASSALKLVGIYDENLRVAEDYDLWLRIAEVAAIHHIPEALYEYAITGEGASFCVDQEKWQQCWTIVHQKRMQRKYENAQKTNR